jgi:hypothetical protein
MVGESSKGGGKGKSEEVNGNVCFRKERAGVLKLLQNELKPKN